jgi:hypothetical protein
MTTTRTADAVMERIVAAIEESRRGHRAAAAAAFDALWAEVGPRGDPFHRCTLAHYAADVQVDARAALRWDERALAAAEELTDERAQAYHAALRVVGFHPSLHLNLAADHRELGDLPRAREHVARARAALAALDEAPEHAGHAATIRTALDRLEVDLSDT